MDRKQSNRWRNRRSTIPAARRRRRKHRRHTKRGGTYYPVVYDVAVAQHGVRNRLFLGVLAIVFTMMCLMVMGVSMLSHFALVAFATFGFCSMCAGFALIASARREEALHRIASDGSPTVLLEPNAGADGSV